MNATPNSVRSSDLVGRLRDYPRARRYLVGFSGGADSTALLYALHRQGDHLGARIEAVHFDHRLHPDSTRWRAHCDSFCKQHGIGFINITLQLSPDMPNLESRAREQRYRYVETLIDSGTIYLTAHHRDDRAETLLLHALRGSGIDGLASIPELRRLGDGYVARPLLGFSRASLTAFLHDRGVDWIEDPSNNDTRMDRNFVRGEIMPLLESRWPAAGANLSRAASHLNTAACVLQDLLSQHLGKQGANAGALPRAALFSLGDSAAGMVFRAWLKMQDVPPPPQPRLEEFIKQLTAPDDDARCEVTWADWSARLFRDELRVESRSSSPECPRLAWHSDQSVHLGRGLGFLSLTGPRPQEAAHWRVGPRRPGGRIQLRETGPRRKLKKLMQEQPIPPWQRASIPVLYWEDRPVAVGDWLQAPEFADWLARRGLEYRWTPENENLQATRTRCHRYLRDETPA